MGIVDLDSLRYVTAASYGAQLTVDEFNAQLTVDEFKNKVLEVTAVIRDDTADMQLDTVRQKRVSGYGRQCS